MPVFQKPACYPWFLETGIFLHDGVYSMKESGRTGAYSQKLYNYTNYQHAG